MTPKQNSQAVAFHKHRYARAALACCVVCSVLFALPAPVSSQKQKPVVYKRVIPVDDAIFPDGKLCVPLAVGMTAGDFFTGLRATPTGLGRRFYKHAAQITEFPAQTTVFVRASMLSCSPFPYIPVSSEDAGHFMDALHFTLEWQSPNLERRAVNGFSVRLISPGPPVWPENQKPIPVWSYILTANSQGVPLTDDLIITITMNSEAGEVHTRMAVHL